jgi:hypothetical protein
MLVTPATMLQHNWYKLQDYFQTDQYGYLQGHTNFIQRIPIMYTPENTDKGAALNFHLTAREKRDVKESFNSNLNRQAISKIATLLKH